METVKLDTAHQTFRELELSNKAIDNKFEWFSQHIMNNNIISISNKLVSSLVTKLTGRELLSVFIIAYYPNDSLSVSKTELENNVYQQANILIDSLNKETIDKNIISEYCDNYYRIFTTWKIRDCEDLISHLSKTHTQIKNLSDSIPDKETTVNTLNKLENIASLLGGQELVEHVKSGAEYDVVDPNILVSQIADQMHQSFWDIFTSELLETPPNFRQYPELVSEIRLRFEKMLANRQNPEILNYIKRSLNDEELRDKITTNTYGLQDIYNLCIFCLEILKEIGAPEDEKTIDFYLEKVHEEMTNSPIKLHEIIANTFKVVLERLDHIGFLKDSVEE